MKKFRIATRNSPLAMKQANMAIEYLSERMEGVCFEILEYKTTGDRRQDWSLEKMGGTGLFTKELQDALLSGEADIAVHSAKDLATLEPVGLCLSGFLPRDSSQDVFVGRADLDLASCIATGSPRRRMQLKKMFPNAVWTEIRGSVNTRLKKISNVDSQIDATILSSAGLLRLGIESFENLKFTPLKVKCCVPAVAQGIIALETRLDLKDEIMQFTHEATTEAFYLERRFLESLGGGCQVAYAAHYDGEKFHIFHENCGYQAYRFSTQSLNERLGEVEELAQGLL